MCQGVACTDDANANDDDAQWTIHDCIRLWLINQMSQKSYFADDFTNVRYLNNTITNVASQNVLIFNITLFIFTVTANVLSFPCQGRIQGGPGARTPPDHQK